MSNAIEPIPGTSDIFPDECRLWQRLEDTARAVFSRYGYGEIRSPVMERTEVFQRTIGDDTDIVQKEMYTFTDRGGRSLTLRPEGTAGIMRAIACAGLATRDQWRLYYFGPMFRGERPAAGRKRQFHQIGAECVGGVAPEIDAECIAMLMDFLQSMGITGTTLLLNSRGVAADREVVARTYSSYFSGHIDSLCADCRRRLAANVWRILDCKNESCQNAIAAAPPMTELLGEDSKAYFARVCGALATLGIPYRIESRLVRGLDYYAHTVFEVVHPRAGAQSSIAGGGRYEFTFPGMKTPMPGVGFAAGVERLLLVQQDDGQANAPTPVTDVYIVSLGAEALNANLGLAAELRRAGLVVLMDLESRGMKAQMRSANKYGARYAVIRGDNELQRQVVMGKDMATAAQSELPIATAVDELRALIQKRQQANVPLTQ